MENLLLNLETEFYFITGIYLEGISGLFLGLILFSIILLAIRFEKKQEPIFSEVDISNEIGNETTAKINLSRSLIEMDQKIEAKRLLEEVLSSNLSKEEAQIASNLLKKLESS